MKKILFLSLISFSVSLFASEDKTVSYYQTILKNYNDTTSLGEVDFTTYPNTLMSGRCFKPNSNEASGSAILVHNRFVDGGPIGSGSDLVSYGMFEKKEKDPAHYDQLSYADYTSGLSQDEIDYMFSPVDMSENLYVNIQNLHLRQSTIDGYFYAVLFAGENMPANVACYFFKNNN